MDTSNGAFPFYLASNACPEIYPNNSPTDFRTRLSKPLRLRGDWECGIKSIAYSANIVDEKEIGRIDCTVTTSKSVDINSMYGYEFKTDKNRWRGLSGSQPYILPEGNFERTPKWWSLVMASLNKMETFIVKRRVRDVPIFVFSSTVINNRTYVTYKSCDPTFALRITKKLSRLLGFFPIRQFEGSATCVARLPVAVPASRRLKRAGSQILAHVIFPTQKEWNEMSAEGARRRAAARQAAAKADVKANSQSEGKLPGQTNASAKRKLPDQTDAPPKSESGIISSTQTVLSLQQSDSRPAHVAPKIKGNLTARDYLVKYFSSNIQKLELTAHIKKDSETSLAPKYAEKFCEIWAREIEKKYPKISAKIKAGKLIIRNNTSNKLVKMSRNLMIALTGGKNPQWMWTYRQECPCIIFSHGAFAAFDIAIFSKNSSQRLNNWYVEIYSDVLDTTKQFTKIEVGVPVRPWHYDNIVNAVKHMNEEVKKTIAGIIPLDYNKSDHAFNLKMISPTRAQVAHGRFLMPKFSANLAQLLGLSEEYLPNSITHADRDVDKLENHRRNLHVQSNIIVPSLYGEQQRHILRGFLHKGGSTPIIEKEFRPIMYQALMNNVIDMIHVQLVTDDYSQFKIKDADTIIVLHFRPVQ